MHISKLAENIIIAAIILTIALFYIFTIRDGHDWGDDFSGYISHAKNIASGIDYNHTGYIYNSSYPCLGPKAYPPIFPFLLFPIIKYYGINFVLMKIENIIFFLLSLFILYLIFKKELSFKYLSALLIIIGFNPFFWDFKDNVLSDLPFLFFLYLSFLIITRGYKNYKLHKFYIIYPILAGFIIYLSYGVRNIGILLIPSLFIYDLIKFRKISLFSLICSLVFFIFVILQTVFLYTGFSYLDNMSVFRSKVMFQNLFLYTKALSNTWNNGYSKIFKNVYFIVFSIFAAIGYGKRLKNKISIIEIFLALYLMHVIIWPAEQGYRFLIPVIPLYVFYAFTGIRDNLFINKLHAKQLVFGISTIIIFISYIGKYTTLDYRYIKEGIGKKETIELFDYIKRNTRKEDIFIFQKPRALALYTGRSASACDYSQRNEDLWKYFQSINASYLIVGEPFETDRSFLRYFVKKYSNNFEAVYSNPDFKVYKIKEYSMK